MYVDVGFLQTFYKSPMGKAVIHNLLPTLQPLCMPLQRRVLVGVGYAIPYLERLAEENLSAQHCAKLYAFMLAPQGVEVWQRKGGVCSSLVCEENLPLADGSVDSVLLIHSLEFAANPQRFLEEIWRILAPCGQVIAVVPHRLGLWAGKEETPFGHGLPYSRGQLQRLFESCAFCLKQIGTGLLLPPRFVQKSGQGLLTRLFPYFGGVLFVQAQKVLYKGLAIKEKQRTPSLLLPQPLLGSSAVGSRSRTLVLKRKCLSR